MAGDIKTLSNMYELNEVNDFMNDPDVTKVLNTFTNIVSRNQEAYSQRVVAQSIVELTALSAVFGVKAKHYMFEPGKSEPGSNKKKNIYLSLKESALELSQSMKYIAKTGM